MTRKLVALILLASMLASLGVVFAPGEQSPAKHFLLNIYVKRDGKPLPSLIYLQALYPSGFKFVAGVATADGRAQFWIDVDEYRNAWAREKTISKRFCTPAFAIVVFTEDWYFDERIVLVKWEDFKPMLFGGQKTVIVEPRFARKASKPIKVKKATSSQEALALTSPLPVVLADVVAPHAILVDYGEEEERVNYVKVVVNENSWTDVDVVYYVGREAGFSVDFLFHYSSDSWTIGDYVLCSKGEGGSADATPGRGVTAYISMVIRWRWEHWEYYTADWEFVDEEVRVYVVDFFPSTLQATPGKDLTNVEKVEETTRTSTDVSKPIYKWIDTEMYSYSIAVDLTWILDAIAAATGGWVKLVAGAGSLLTDIEVMNEGTVVFYISVDIFADAGTTHRIEHYSQYFDGAPSGYYSACYWYVIKV